MLTFNLFCIVFSRKKYVQAELRKRKALQDLEDNDSKTVAF